MLFKSKALKVLEFSVFENRNRTHLCVFCIYFDRSIVVKICAISSVVKKIVVEKGLKHNSINLVNCGIRNHRVPVAPVQIRLIKFGHHYGHPRQWNHWPSNFSIRYQNNNYSLIKPGADFFRFGLFSNIA